MRSQMFRTAMLFLAFLIIASDYANSGEEERKYQDRITLDVEDKLLSVVLRYISEKSGKNIFFNEHSYRTRSGRNCSRNYIRISVNLDNVPVDEAIKQICLKANVRPRLIDRNIWKIENPRLILFAKKNIPLIELIDWISRISGKNIVFHPKALTDKKISIRVLDFPWDELVIHLANWAELSVLTDKLGDTVLLATQEYAKCAGEHWRSFPIKRDDRKVNSNNAFSIELHDKPLSCLLDIINNRGENVFLGNNYSGKPLDKDDVIVEELKLKNVHWKTALELAAETVDARIFSQKNGTLIVHQIPHMHIVFDGAPLDIALKTIKNMSGYSTSISPSITQDFKLPLLDISDLDWDQSIFTLAASMGFFCIKDGDRSFRIVKDIKQPGSVESPINKQPKDPRLNEVRELKRRISKLEIEIILGRDENFTNTEIKNIEKRISNGLYTTISDKERKIILLEINKLKNRIKEIHAKYPKDSIYWKFKFIDPTQEEYEFAKEFEEYLRNFIELTEICSSKLDEFKSKKDTYLDRIESHARYNSHREEIIGLIDRCLALIPKERRENAPFMDIFKSLNIYKAFINKLISFHKLDIFVSGKISLPDNEIAIVNNYILKKGETITLKNLGIESLKSSKLTLDWVLGPRRVIFVLDGGLSFSFPIGERKKR
jgi:hypothetical protein